MTDNEFLLRVLNDGKWHSNMEILAASLSERGCGLTVHSRAADLRKRGYTVETEQRTSNRRISFYRLVGALEDAGAGVSLLPVPATASSSASAPDVSAAVEPDPSHEGSGGQGALHLFDLPPRGAYPKEAAA